MSDKKMTFTFENPRIQYFSLPSNVIYLLWKNPQSAIGILKLYQTCKFFYSKQKVAFFDEIVFSKKYQKSDDSPILKFDDSILLILLCKKVEIWSKVPAFFDNLKNMRIFLSPTSLSLNDLKLKYDEFKILTSNPTIKEFKLYDCDLCYSDNTTVTIDTVLANLPNVESFRYQNNKDLYPLEALENLQKIKLWNKLKFIRISIYCELSDTFKPELLSKFIKNNIAPRGNIRFSINGMTEAQENSLVKEFKRMRENWDNWKTAPSLRIWGPYECFI